MKILFVVGEFPKLSQTFILNQITGLIDAGHDVKVLAKCPADDRKVHEDVKRYQLDRKSIYYCKSAARTRFGKLVQFAAGLGALLAGRVMGRGERLSLRDLKQHPNLILLIRCLQHADLTDREIILAHFGPNGILAQKCLNMGLLSGKLFVAFHGYDMLRYPRQKGPGVYRELFRSSAVLLPISEFWKKRLITLGADPLQIHVHHMGIDPAVFSGEAADPAPHMQIVSAARLVEKKGLRYGIQAIFILKEKGISVHYAIAGDGPLKESLEQQITDLQLDQDVRLLGWQTQQEWIGTMKQAQIVLAPSVTAADGDMEGIPVQLMEAMAMGKIVLSTQHSGIPELVRDKFNGYLVTERDAEGLAERIGEIVHHPDKWPQISENARQTIAKEFNIRIQNQRLVQLFEGKISECTIS